jgi:hypothetical protein
MLAGLILWSVAPAAFGWHPTVVMSGSMLPRLVPGDVVVSRPVAPADLTVGQVVLVDDPDHPGRLRLHRLVRVAADGRLILRGDANRAVDSSPVARSAVHGVASLRVPYIGRPVLASAHRGPLLVGLGLALLLLLRLATWWRPAAPADDEPGTDDDGTQPDSRHREPATVGTATGPRTITRLGTALTVSTMIVLAGADSAQAALPFSRTTTNPSNTWAANQYFKCGNAEIGDGAAFAWPLSEASGTLANDITANNYDGTYAGGVTRKVAGPCPRDGTTAVTLNGTSGTIASAVTASNLPNISLEVWFKSSGTHGGPLMSISNTTTTTMAMAVTSAGTVTLAIAASGTKSVTTPTTFNDAKWHLAVGVIGAAGMALYLDNNAPVTSTAVTTAASASGTRRAGFAYAANLGLGSFNYFAGSVAYSAGYTLALTASQAAAHYFAGT